jgi:hypothetical protein
MVARTHNLKTYPSDFEAVLSGKKTFEIRYNDRDFAEGDMLVLEEWDPTPTVYMPRGYTRRRLKCHVSCLVHGGRYGLDQIWVVMGLKDVIEDSR